MNASPPQKLVWTLRLLCSIALAISGYLTWAALNKTGVAGCGGSVFDCDHVLSSKWSSWFVMPVSAGALGLYSVAIGALAFCGQRAMPRQREFAWKAFTACGLAAGLAAIWFISLQVFVIGHFCSYCLVAHACGLVIAGTLLWKRPLGTGLTAKLGSLSAAGVTALIGGQLLTPEPQTFLEEFHVSADPVAARISPAPGDTESEIFEAPGEDIFEAPSDDVFEAPSFDDDDIFEAPTFDDADFETDTEDAPVENES